MFSNFRGKSNSVSASVHFHVMKINQAITVFSLEAEEERGKNKFRRNTSFTPFTFFGVVEQCFTANYLQGWWQCHLDSFFLVCHTRLSHSVSPLRQLHKYVSLAFLETRGDTHRPSFCMTASGCINTCVWCCVSHCCLPPSFSRWHFIGWRLMEEFPFNHKFLKYSQETVAELKVTWLVLMRGMWLFSYKNQVCLHTAFQCSFQSIHSIKSFLYN